jgi:hypothetical protein
VVGQRHAPAALLPGKRPGIHCIGGWVSPRADLDGCEKSRRHRYSMPGPSSTVASRYTAYAIPAHQIMSFASKYTYIHAQLKIQVRSSTWHNNAMSVCLNPNTNIAPLQANIILNNSTPTFKSINIVTERMPTAQVGIVLTPLEDN